MILFSLLSLDGCSCSVYSLWLRISSWILGLFFIHFALFFWIFRLHLMRMRVLQLWIHVSVTINCVVWYVIKCFTMTEKWNASISQKKFFLCTWEYFFAPRNFSSTSCKWRIITWYSSKTCGTYSRTWISYKCLGAYWMNEHVRGAFIMMIVCSCFAYERSHWDLS